MYRQKLKTKRGAAKRFRFTAHGNIKCQKAYASHILTKKTRKRKRNLKKGSFIAPADKAVVRHLLPYG